MRIVRHPETVSDQRQRKDNVQPTTCGSRYKHPKAEREPRHEMAQPKQVLHRLPLPNATFFLCSRLASASSIRIRIRAISSLSVDPLEPRAQIGRAHV